MMFPRAKPSRTSYEAFLNGLAFKIRENNTPFVGGCVYVSLPSFLHSEKNKILRILEERNFDASIIEIAGKVSFIVRWTGLEGYK